MAKRGARGMYRKQLTLKFFPGGMTLREKSVLFEYSNLYEKASFSDDKRLIRRKKRMSDDMRTPFERDRHRIIFSDAFRAYRGKTQVFSLSNYLLSDRMVHVNYVAQVSRMIAKALDLNVDLTEAIAYGHDLGHPPFGHDGEYILSEICQHYGIGHFHHNVHGVRVVDEIERNGEGLNLTFAVRDGIASHDGEVHNMKLEPEWEKTDEDLENYLSSKVNGEAVQTFPATLEGCVVRIADTVAYIGSDIEDAIKLGIIKRKELPRNLVEILGNTNGKIIETIVKDIVRTSYHQPFVSFSKEISDAVLELKKWNYENIYLRWQTRNDEISMRLRKEKEKIRTGLWRIFEEMLFDLETGRKESPVYKFFMKMSRDYREKYGDKKAVVVRDFIASLTDAEAQRLIAESSVPRSIFDFVKSF